MSDQQGLLYHLEEIKAVSEENIKYCDIPYWIFIEEVELLYSRAKHDLPMLQAFHFDAAKLDRMLSLTGAMRTAQNNWESKQTLKQVAIENWRKEAPIMYELHDELLDFMDFAFRNCEDLLIHLSIIKQGDSKANIIEDMASLSVLGKDNLEMLKAVNFEVEKLDVAAEIAHRMRALVGEINGKMCYVDEIKLTRDRCYTLLREVVDEVQDFGKFVFRKNQGKRQGYISKYNRESMAAYRTSNVEEFGL
ncbi:hypothetical protein [Marinifilum sp. D737]|uniref:hypothetical protein n=1 Tax=Marinifilum sp. D737 TaxID=2969628 RepID=UPI0022743E36|nr:hypothetical protein [Marinifilum sp. D737]MCY1635454.1 hypothetical protein [Marinifilum sp. D737]